MKKAKLVLPMKLGEHFAEWSFTNGLKLMLSYTTSDGFLGENITAIVAVPDDKEELFKSEFKNYIKG